MSSAIRQGMPGWDRLYAMWVGQGHPGYVLSGENSYQVATPNGEESPVFISQSNEAAYGSVSVEPVQETPKKATQKGSGKGGKK